MRLVRQDGKPQGGWMPDHASSSSSAPCFDFTIGNEASAEVDARCQLGEGPIWDERLGRLYFCDIDGKLIHGWEPDTGKTLHIPVPHLVPNVSLTSDPTKLIASFERTVALVDVETGEVGDAIAATPEEHGVEAMRFNDGKPSPAGVLLDGRMHMEKWSQGVPGRSYRLELTGPGPRGRFVSDILAPSEVVLPNGIAWDEASHVVYINDTYAGTVTAYDADDLGMPARDAGGVLRARLVAKIPREQGQPDGMTIDADGNLWVALMEGGAVVCVDPHSGAILEKITFPTRLTTACTFGGAALDQLYVTTIGDPEVLEAERGPGWGCVYGVAPGARGAAGAYKIPLP